jgi:hypothetical protein
VSADRDLRARLAGLIKRETGMPFTSKLAADSVMTDSALLDDICEYRARQINTEVGRGRRWETAAEVPADVTIRTADCVNWFTWRRRDTETFEQFYDGIDDGWTHQDSLTGTWPDGFSEVTEKRSAQAPSFTAGIAHQLECDSST